MLIEQAGQVDPPRETTARSDFADGSQSSVDARLAPTHVRRGEAVTAAIRVGETTPSEWRVWQISGEGIELCEPDYVRSRAALVALADRLFSIERDTCVAVRLQVGSQKICTAAYALCGDQTRGGLRMIRLRWMQRAWDEFETPWPCTGASVPYGTARHPAIFGRRLSFAVEAIGRQALRVSLAADEELVFPGLVLPATISFPAVGPSACQLEVQAVRAHPEDQHRMQAIFTFNNASRALSESIGQYLLQDGPWVTPSALRRAGYRPTSIAQACSIRTANVDAERLEAGALRNDTYAAAGKLATDGRTLPLIDEYDERARILIARHKGLIIASLRLMYHEAGDEFEHERFTTLPADLDRDRTIEITRICTHPDFRGGDLLTSMMQAAMLRVVESGRWTVLGSATEKLLPVYERIGMKRVGGSWRHGDLNGLEHWLIVGDARQGISGRGVGPMAWNVLWADVWAHAISTEIVRPRRQERARTAAYRMLRPLSRAAQRRHAQRHQGRWP